MTDENQAYFELNSTEKKQRDKGYNDEGVVAVDALPLPMLAKPFDQAGHRITYPCTLQHKYDGNRCLSDGKTAWSRKKIEFIPQVVAHLIGNGASQSDGQVTLFMLLGDTNDCGGKLNTVIGGKTYIVDGELIMPHGTNLQQTNSAIKKFDAKTSPKLIYRIYDVISDLSYPERYEICRQIVEQSNNPQIVLAPVVLAECEEDIFAFHETCKKQGWEGAIIRLHGEGYRIGQRVTQLIKLKDFVDAEFQVVRVEENERGKYNGTAKLICLTAEGKEFAALPIGTIEYKKELVAKASEVIGTFWTVRYQALTDEGKPTFARAINQRDASIQG